MIFKFKAKVPMQRDIILLDFDPQAGVEIQKRRPALVISATEFQRHTGLAVVAPITSTIRESFPLHVKISGECSVHGDILCEQIKSMDYTARNWKKVAELAPEPFTGVQETIAAILDLQ